MHKPRIEKIEIDYETIDGFGRQYKLGTDRAGQPVAVIETKRLDRAIENLRDDVTLHEVQRIAEMMDPSPDISNSEVLDCACRVIPLDPNRLRKLDVKIEFNDGKKIRAKLP